MGMIVQQVSNILETVYTEILELEVQMAHSSEQRAMIEAELTEALAEEKGIVLDALTQLKAAKNVALFLGVIYLSLFT